MGSSIQQSSAHEEQGDEAHYAGLYEEAQASKNSNAAKHLLEYRDSCEAKLLLASEQAHIPFTRSAKKVLRSTKGLANIFRQSKAPTTACFPFLIQR